MPENEEPPARRVGYFLFLIFDACKNYNDYFELTQKTLSGAVDQAYTYAYKDNAARDLEYVGIDSYKFYPLSDVNGRNTGREIVNGTAKLAAEYITYRKVGDHATNMPASVWFATGTGVGAYAIREGMNGRTIYLSEAIGQGINMAFKGLFAFGTGMMLATTGIYNNLVKGVAWSLSEKMKYAVVRAIVSAFFQQPFRNSLK